MNMLQILTSRRSEHPTIITLGSLKQMKKFETLKPADLRIIKTEDADHHHHRVIIKSSSPMRRNSSVPEITLLCPLPVGLNKWTRTYNDLLYLVHLIHMVVVHSLSQDAQAIFLFTMFPQSIFSRTAKIFSEKLTS